MVEVAKLSLTADTTGLKSAVPVLDSLVAAGKRAQTTSAQLRAQIAQTDAELKKLKASGTGAKSEIDRLASSLTGLRVALAQSKAESMALANDMHAMKSASSVAGHSVGNLTAQLFDVGVMMQAGQNPFVMMVQQGSQIAQVMGPMGAKGAIQALMASVTQLINPMNLVIFASIGIAAAVVPIITNWLTATEEVKSFADQLEHVKKLQEEFQAAAQASLAPVDQLVEKYGALAMVAAVALREDAEKKKSLAMQSLQSTVDGLALSLGGLYQQEVNIGGQVGSIVPAMQALQVQFNFTEQAASQFLGLLRDLENAEGPVQIADAARAIREWLEQAYGSVEKMPPALGAIYDGLNDGTIAAAELQGTLDLVAGTADRVDQIAAQINSTIASADGSALRAAFASAFPVASQLLGMANAIRNALSLGKAVDSLNKQGLAAQYAQYGAGRAAFDAAAKASGSLYTPFDYPTVEDFGGGPPPGRPMDLGVSSDGGGGGGGGRSQAAKDAEKQAEAIKKVTDNLQSEIDMVGKSEEARRLHQELQKAGVDIYSAEGQKIAELVERLTELEAKQKLVAETMKGIENAAEGFFMGVLSGAKDLQTAIGDLLRELGNLFLKQAFQMLWNGTGGGGGVGGWLAGLFDAGGKIPAGQFGVVAEKRPEFVNGKLVTRPTLVPGPANVTGGYDTSNILERVRRSTPSAYGGAPNRSIVSAPQISVSAPSVVVLDDPRKIDDYNRSLRGERAYARNRRRMTNA